MVSYYTMKKDTPFVVAGRTFNSRLLVGSGKYKDLKETRLATEASGWLSNEKVKVSYFKIC